jgi:hypothetical protein
MEVDHPCTPGGVNIYREITFGITILGLTFFVYLWASWRAFLYPRSVFRRSARMAFLYPVNYFLCFGPMHLAFFHVVKFEVAKIFWAMNGLGNALVYSCNSKYVQRERIDAKNANGDDEVEAWSGLVSCYVVFEERVDVVELTPRNSCKVDF